MLLYCMALDDTPLRLQRDWNESDSVLPPEVVDQMLPADSLFLNLSHCVSNLVLEDGTPAPDEKFFYTVEFDFSNRGDRQDFLNHPDRVEIVASMESFMLNDPGVTESFTLELDRDRNPVYVEAGESGYNSLTSGTIGDLEVSVNEMINIVNSSYNVEIQGGRILSGSYQVQGCDLSSGTIPENLAGVSQDSPQQESAQVVADYSGGFPIRGF